MPEKELTILIVDDDQHDLAGVVQTLSVIHLQTLTTRDPHEVLQKVESARPDLVILDALLPGMSGFDICKQIKSKSTTKGTLVVILTGVYLKDRYRREAIHQFKADGFVTKPYREKDLQRLVLRLLAKKLKTNPNELQRRLAVSKEVLPHSRVEEKPGWVSRLFGRKKTEPSVSSGFLHTASEPESPAASSEEEIPEEVQAVVAESEATPAEVESAEPEQPVAPPETELVPAEKEEPAPGLSPAEEALEDEARWEEEIASELRAEPEPQPSMKEDELPEGEPVEPVHVAESLPDEGADARPGEEPKPESEVREEGPSGLEAARVVFKAFEIDDETTGGGEEKNEPGGVEAVEEEVEEEKEEQEEQEQPEKTPLPVPSPIEEEPESIEPEARETVESETAPAQPDAFTEELAIYQEEDFLHELRREVLKCKRVDRPLTLILIRIADLGQITELFGKEFRPKVLRHVAVRALESLREVDMVGLLVTKELLALTAFASDRYGGERIVNRLQATLGRNPFQVGEGIPSFIPKLRFGMATYPVDAANLEEMLERAESEVELASSPS